MNLDGMYIRIAESRYEIFLCGHPVSLKGM